MTTQSNILLTIAYDGTPFLGWQETQEGPSIEGELKKALKILLKEDVEINGASRTDAGVHALGQIANFHTERKPDFFKFLKSINGLLPIEIRVTSIEEVDLQFHATLNNRGKRYLYRLSYGPAQYPHLRRTEWHTPGPLNIEAMRKAATLLEGTHDFKAFCNTKKNETYASTVRKLDRIEIKEQDNQTLEIVIEGNQFLYKMVRNLIGTLVYIGRGKITLEELVTLLESKDRTEAGPTAPAHGLTLFRVFREIVNQKDDSQSDHHKNR